MANVQKKGAFKRKRLKVLFLFFPNGENEMEGGESHAKV